MYILDVIQWWSFHSGWGSVQFWIELMWSPRAESWSVSLRVLSGHPAGPQERTCCPQSALRLSWTWLRGPGGGQERRTRTCWALFVLNWTLLTTEMKLWLATLTMLLYQRQLTVSLEILLCNLQVTGIQTMMMRNIFLFKILTNTRSRTDQQDYQNNSTRSIKYTYNTH